MRMNPCCVMYSFCVLLVPLVAAVNLAPQFVPGGDMSRFSLPENTLVGTSVYTLRGTDPEGSQVFYSISGDHFSVNRDTGTVTLVKELDRETQPVIDVIISITDTAVGGGDPNIVSLGRSINVLDVNDNAPVFHEVPYALSIKETTPVGTIVFKQISITDADGGTNGDVQLSCSDDISPDACDTFSVREVRFSEGRFGGIVTLRRELDYEKASVYTLTIRAEDQARGSRPRFTTTANIVVDIGDVQDQPPAFLKGPYSKLVAENTPPGTFMLDVRVQDRDTGNPRPLRLQLLNENSGFFTLSNQRTDANGVVSAELLTSNKPIDREDPQILANGGLYIFQIKATELIDGEPIGDTAISNVTIVVTDQDDQKPSFNRQHFTIDVPENIGNGVPLPGLNVIVSDRDSGDNAAYTLSLEGPDSMFSIFPTHGAGRTPVIVKVADTSRLDYERVEARQFTLALVVSQDSLPVETATVTVNVVDSNDNSPIFNLRKYEFDVSEYDTAETMIAMVTASDNDSGTSGQLKYSLKGFGSEKFYVNEDTGGIYLAECGLDQCLDYETQKSYSLTYTAEDGGGRAASVSLLINVLDENDNRPQFDKKEYRRTIDEGVTAFNPPLFVQARDLDGPSQGGGKVFYSIVSGNTPDDELFFVEPISGEIKFQRPATHPGTDTGRYRLMVRAIDGGNPPLHKDVPVIITVGSEDNQRPIFRTAPYVGYVKENDLPGKLVLSVKANDPDGIDEQLRYYIHSGAKDNFVIDDQLGEIRVASEANLDKDVRGSSYELIIQAVDSGEPPQTGSTTIRIEVEDINNKPPQFLEDDYIDYVSEREGVGQKLLQVTANDPDMSAEIKYSIVEPIVASDRTGVRLAPASTYDYKNTFKIEEDGSIVVNNVLDSKSASVITFTVQAEDVNAEVHKPQTAKAEVTIYIQSFSDDNPIFSSPWTPADPRIKLSLEEETLVLSTVYMLSATDPLTQLPISNFEKVPESDPDQFFTVLPTGEVTLQKRLDYEKLPDKTLQLIVQARGLNGNSQAKLLFNITDINDHSPAFQQSRYKVEVLESWLYPQSFLRVSATDEDSEYGYGDIVYSLEGEGHEMFAIDPDTGEVTVAPKHELDREERDSYILTVTARDMPKSGDYMQTTVPLEIVLLDVNDNPPEFLLSSPPSEPCQYTAVVPENAPVGFKVIRISAIDLDDEENGNVEFSIPPGDFLSDFFSINLVPGRSDEGKSTGAVMVKSSLAGKGRSERYELHIEASDKGSPSKSSIAQLCMLIGDVSKNDGVPVIISPKPDEIVSISENSSIGTQVYRVKASDPDNPHTDNGRLFYSFLGNDLNIPFKIDPSSGIIVTSQALDREQKQDYKLVLLVQDLGSPPQQASRELLVKVTDIDDHQPVFPKELRLRPLEVSVEEEVNAGTVVATVAAQDKDEGNNSRIVYYIVGGNDNGTFGVNNTEDNKAVVYTVGRVDREQTKEFLLSLKCSPQAEPFKRQLNLEDPSIMQLRIIVEDIDDNLPRFTKGNLTLSVHVQSAPYVELARFEAVDEDSGNEMRYNLTSVKFYRLQAGDVEYPSLRSAFFLDPVTGVLKTGTDSYKQFTNGYFHLKVEARNSNYSTVSTEAKVFVLRDTDLLKFVFDSPPRIVRGQLEDFKMKVEEALRLPISLNLYGSQYYSHSDGRLDTTSTSSCFQLLDEEEVYSISDAKFVLDPTREEKLKEVYKQFEMRRLERCAEEPDSYHMSWVELWVVGIAAFIALTGFIATLVLCGLHAMYVDRVKRMKYIQIHEAAGVPSVINEWPHKPQSIYAPH